MGFLDSFLRPSAGPAVDHSDFWFYPVGESTASESGIYAQSNAALQTSAVWACVRIISQTIGSLPLFIYRRTGETGRQRAVNHPLYQVLRNAPNDNNTAFEFIETQVVNLLLRGNAYAFIQPGSRGFADKLIPLHPDAVTPILLPGKDRLVYDVATATGERFTYNADEIAHWRGLSLDGWVGVSVLGYARETIGLQIAQERYRARFFKNNATPAIALMYENKVADDARARILADLNSEHGGIARAHRAMLLDQGAKIEKIGLSAEDSQWLESTQFGVTEICRWFLMQPHKVFDLSRATFSNIEHQAIEHVVDTIRPWCVRIEQSINRDLLLPEEKETLYVEFLLDALLRGDFKTRMEGYQIGIQNGILSPNEARSRENLNERSDGLGDVYLRPANIVPAGTPAAPAAPAAPAEPDADETDDDASEEPADDADETTDEEGATE